MFIIAEKYGQQSGSNRYIWIGIAQRDVNQRGVHRDFKWVKSNEDIPSTSEYWENRVIPQSNLEACGMFDLNGPNSKFHDSICSSPFKVICEW